MTGPEGDAYFCDVCMDDISKCDRQSCPGAPHPDDPNTQAEEAARQVDTTLAAYALNLLHGAQLTDFERENLLALAERAGAKVGPGHERLALDRRQREASVAAKLAERDALREALARCRDQFRRYQHLHQLKPDGAGREKAQVNGEFADMCDAALK